MAFAICGTGNLRFLFFIQTVYFSFHFFPEYEAMSILLSFAISLSSLVCILFGYSHSFYIFIFPIGTHSIFSSVSFHTDVMLCYNSLTPCLGMAVAFCFLLLYCVYVTIRFCYTINWHIVATILWQHDPNEWLIYTLCLHRKIK